MNKCKSPRVGHVLAYLKNSKEDNLVRVVKGEEEEGAKITRGLVGHCGPLEGYEQRNDMILYGIYQDHLATVIRMDDQSGENCRNSGER